VTLTEPFRLYAFSTKQGHVLLIRWRPGRHEFKTPFAKAIFKLRFRGFSPNRLSLKQLPAIELWWKAQYDRDHGWEWMWS